MMWRFESFPGHKISRLIVWLSGFCFSLRCTKSVLFDKTTSFTPFSFYLSNAPQVVCDHPKGIAVAPYYVRLEAVTNHLDNRRISLFGVTDCQRQVFVRPGEIRESSAVIIVYVLTTLWSRNVRIWNKPPCSFVSRYLFAVVSLISRYSVVLVPAIISSK